MKSLHGCQPFRTEHLEDTRRVPYRLYLSIFANKVITINMRLNDQ